MEAFFSEATLRTICIMYIAETKFLEVLRDYTDFRDRFSWMATDSSFYAAGGCFPSWVLPNLYISNWGVAKVSLFGGL